MIETIHPEGWPRARGYAHGMVASGRTVYVAGQIGWDTNGELAHEDFASELGQALDNVLEVVRTAGGKPEHVVQMTLYLTDLGEYLQSAKAMGEVWRARFGKHYPAMAAIGVAGLLHPQSRVEIQAIATIPD